MAFLMLSILLVVPGFIVGRLVRVVAYQIRGVGGKGSIKMKGGAMTESELLEMLESPDPKVRKTAAKDSNATEAVLLKALEDGDPTVRRAAAKNRNATEAVLLCAFEDENSGVRFEAMTNRAITLPLLWKALENIMTS
jgi:hypothetical protein